MYGLFPVCRRLWWYKVVWWVNKTSHTSHLNGFSPVWARLCEVRLELVEKAFIHISHTYGLAPVCVRRCKDRWVLREKRLQHILHKKGLSPKCNRIWESRYLRFLKDLLQVSHLWVVSESSIFCVLWTVRSPLKVPMIIVLLVELKSPDTVTQPCPLSTLSTCCVDSPPAT